MPRKTPKLDRRSLITGAAVASVAAIAGRDGVSVAKAEGVSAQTPNNGIQVATRGQYAKVALKQESINVAAVQSQLYSIDLRDRAKTLRRNLDRVLRLIDLAQNSP